MSALATSNRTPAARPATITWSVILTVALNIGVFGAFLMPGSDEIPVAAIVVGAILGAICIALCWPLWNGKRWAATTLAVLTALNTLSSIPGLFDPPSAGILAVIIAGIVATVVLIWLIYHPDSRRFYREA